MSEALHFAQLQSESEALEPEILVEPEMEELPWGWRSDILLESSSPFQQSMNYGFENALAFAPVLLLAILAFSVLWIIHQSVTSYFRLKSKKKEVSELLGDFLSAADCLVTIRALGREIEKQDVQNFLFCAARLEVRSLQPQRMLISSIRDLVLSADITGQGAPAEALQPKSKLEEFEEARQALSSYFLK